VHAFFAVCPPGLRSLCRRELTGLDADIQDIQQVPGGVSFSCKPVDAFLAALWLRSPSRIYMRIARFKADRFAILEKKIQAVDWELFLPAGTDPAIQVTTRTSRLYHSDAVADRCRPIIQAALKSEPSQNPGAQTVMVRAENDRFEISLDLSGPPLFKRGIKHRVADAPLRENLAFALLDAAGFTADDVLMDPMCGSGTFSIEGAMVQARIPAGFFRTFAFEAWPAFSAAGFGHAKSQAAKNFSPAGPVFASDLDPEAMAALKANLAGQPFLAPVTACQQDFFAIVPERLTPKKGVVVLNPPYGRRIGKNRDTAAFYREITAKLAADFKGWRVALVFPGNHLPKMVQLRLQPFHFFHGGLDLTAGIGIV